MVDLESGKIFVGGIPWETDSTTLKDYFSRYGEISYSVIAKDRDTGKPRGFAFVTFVDPSSALKALSEHHEISGRTVEVKTAKPKYEQRYHQSSHIESSGSEFRTRKIFVGGLSANVTEEEFKAYFDKFGRITDVVVMYDNVTNRPRGFGFITFDSEDVVEKITKNSFHVLDGKYVEVKKAIPKELSRNSSIAGQNSGFWPGNANLAYYPGGQGIISANGYGGVYGTGYHMAWPGYSYGMPLVAANNHWNGFGMVSYLPLSNGPSSARPMNMVSGYGSLAVSNGVDNSVGSGSDYDVQD